MLPTPTTSHVNYDRIYEPAEDSYLLLDTLSSFEETAFLQRHLGMDTPSPIVLEVGTGSGVVLAFINAHSERIVGRTDVATIGTDVNWFACVATKQTVERAVTPSSGADGKPGVFLDSLRCDLTAAIMPGSIDILIFNPPYVPSEALPSIPDDSGDAGVPTSNPIFEHDTLLLALSTDGGVDGMQTTNRLLSQLDSVLSPRGVAYILLCAQNRPEEVITRIRGWPSKTFDGCSSNWIAEKVGSSGKKAGWERLCVLRIWRS